MPVPKKYGSYRQAILVRARGHAHAMPVPGPFTGPSYLRVQQLQSLQNQNRHTGVSKWQVTGAFQAACQTDHAAAKQCPIARCVVSKLFVRHHLLIGRARQEMSKTTDMLVHVVSDLTSHPFSLTVVSLQLIHQSTTLQHSLTSRDVKDPRHARPHCQ